MTPASLAQQPKIQPPLQSSFGRNIDDYFLHILLGDGEEELAKKLAGTFVRNLEVCIALDDHLSDFWTSLLDIATDFIRARKGRPLNRGTEDSKSLDLRFEGLRRAIGSASAKMVEDQNAWRMMVHALREPMERKMQRRQMLAEAALKGALRTTGREQKAYYSDAYQLFRQVIDNTMGIKDYSSWFEVGWLQWKFEAGYARASEAFQRAAKVCEGTGNLCEWLALRHYAHMRYLMGDFGSAVNAIARAVQARPTHDTLLEAGRLSALTGELEQAISFFAQVARENPCCLPEIFADDDLRAFHEQLYTCFDSVVAEAREDASNELVELAKALDLVLETGKKANFEFTPPQKTMDLLQSGSRILNDCDPIVSREIQADARSQIAQLYQAAEYALEKESLARAEAVRRLAYEVSESASDSRNAILYAKKAMDAALIQADKKRDEECKPEFGFSGIVAVLISAYSSYSSDDVGKGVAIFIPAFLAALLITYTINSSKAASRHYSMVKLAKQEYSSVSKEHEHKLKKVIPKMQETIQQMERERSKVEAALKTLREREERVD